MAFDKTPSVWILGWSEDGTNITVPIASFPELTAVEADGTSGDIRKILFALMEKLISAWNSTPIADRPAKMNIFRSTNVNDQTGVVTKQFSLIFNTVISGQEVQDEA